jgi:hypothetical protein
MSPKIQQTHDENSMACIFTKNVGENHQNFRAKSIKSSMIWEAHIATKGVDGGRHLYCAQGRVVMDGLKCGVLNLVAFHDHLWPVDLDMSKWV